MNLQAALRRILLWTGVVAAAVLVIGGGIGWAVVGVSGLASAAIGAAMALVFCGVTVVSILVGRRFSLTAMFGIIMGAWIVKIVIFLILLSWLQPQPWVNRTVVFLCLIVAVLGTLAIDTIVILRARIPYVSDVELPRHDPESQD